MKIYNLSSSCVIIEGKYSTILTDPWLVNGEYYGSWWHPEIVQFDDELMDRVTHIYLSHIHPDHFSRRTFEKIDKNVPVMIHNYATKFLKMNVERFGFRVEELDHNKEHIIDEEIRIKILAADNCNPELCSKFMGCAPIENNYQSTQIDSLSLIYNDKFSILNTNDCPYELSLEALGQILKEHNKIDLLLTSYAGAGPFPQCFDMTENVMIDKAEKKKLKFLEQGRKFIETVKPIKYMPFAGTYMLAGSLYNLNKYRGVPEIKDAFSYFQKRIKNSEGIYIEKNEYLDLETNKYIKYKDDISAQRHQDYLNEVRNAKLDYELDEYPSEQSILNLLPSSFERFNKKREEINFSSKYVLIIEISSIKSIVIYMADECYYEVRDNYEYKKLNDYLKISLDLRLLYKILQGPRFGHWNNAEVGSHLTYDRSDDVHQRGLHHALCFFHS